MFLLYVARSVSHIQICRSPIHPVDFATCQFHTNNFWFSGVSEAKLKNMVFNSLSMFFSFFSYCVRHQYKLTSEGRSPATEAQPNKCTPPKIKTLSKLDCRAATGSEAAFLNTRVSTLSWNQYSCVWNSRHLNGSVVAWRRKVAGQILNIM